MTSAGQAGRRLLRRAKYFVGDQPALMPLYLRLTPEGTSRAITAETDLVIEGFPRSGNTFAVFALRAANPGISIASHIHHFAPIKTARKQRLPLLIAIREPLGCLSSYLVAGSHARPSDVLHEYLSYYSALVSIDDGVVFATFDQIVGSYGTAIGRLNARFDTQFNGYDNDAESDTEVISTIKTYHASVHRHRRPTEAAPVPQPGRDEIKAQYRLQLQSPDLGELLQRAHDLYNEVAKRAID